MPIPLEKQKISLKEKIEFMDGTTEVHYVSPIGDATTLCGDDTAGDTGIHGRNGGYEYSTNTYEKVDCRKCIKLVNFCKQINKLKL